MITLNTRVFSSKVTTISGTLGDVLVGPLGFLAQSFEFVVFSARVHLTNAARGFGNHAIGLLLLVPVPRGQDLSRIAFEDCCHSSEGAPLQDPIFAAIAQQTDLRWL